MKLLRQSLVNKMANQQKQAEDTHTACYILDHLQELQFVSAHVSISLLYQVQKQAAFDFLNQFSGLGPGGSDGGEGGSPSGDEGEGDREVGEGKGDETEAWDVAERAEEKEVEGESEAGGEVEAIKSTPSIEPAHQLPTRPSPALVGPPALNASSETAVKRYLCIKSKTDPAGWTYLKQSFLALVIELLKKGEEGEAEGFLLQRCADVNESEGKFNSGAFLGGVPLHLQMWLLPSHPLYPEMTTTLRACCPALSSWVFEVASSCLFANFLLAMMKTFLSIFLKGGARNNA